MVQVFFAAHLSFGHIRRKHASCSGLCKQSCLAQMSISIFSPPSTQTVPDVDRGALFNKVRYVNEKALTSKSSYYLQMK